MTQRIATVICLILALSSSLIAQKIEVKAKGQPLNQVLVELRERYDFQFSFNDELLARYRVNTSKEFDDKEAAIRFLLKNFPLNYKMVNGVFLIYAEIKQKQYLVAGRVMDVETLEPLPFSHLTINDHPMVSDQDGNFSFTTPRDSTFRVLISHLGYFVQDTTLLAGGNQKLMLQPASTDLPEVTITDKVVQNFIRMGNQAGALKLNHKIAGFLPTNDDNSVFNLLRLQPGILAAGEQSKDITIWGSYEGESQVLFDDITIWGLKNFYDGIGAVNPLVVKNIEVLKGGYDARYGERVGGIVYITGKNGNRMKPTLNLSLNNITASGSYEQPLGKKSSLLLAFRHTYYNLYEEEKVKYSTSNAQIPNNSSQSPQSFNLKVVPDYSFQDYNLKFSTMGDHGDAFHISLMGAKDQFEYEILPESYNQIKKFRKEKNEQMGGSMNYSKNWRNGNTSSFVLSGSQFNTSSLNTILVTRKKNGETILRRDDQTQNEVQEFKGTVNNRINLPGNQVIEFGLGLIRNKINLEEDSLSINILNLKSISDRANCFLHNQFHLSKRLTAKLGLRATYPLNLKKIYWEPRISFSFTPSEPWSLNAAWGIYNQFIAKSSVLDESGNFHYIWSGSNDNEIPVLKSQHLVGGWAFHKNSFTLSMEAFYKTTEGHTRYYQYRRGEFISQGDSRSYGLDTYVKKDFGDHTFWVSYTLGRTEERFDYFKEYDYRRALHDQRHEIKAAGLLSFRPFYLSANYIYGSGFPLYSSRQGNEYSEPDYNRLDAALIYKFVRKKFQCEVGVQFLNILDAENIKYSSFEKIPLDQVNTININTESVPRALRLYLKVTI